MGSFTSRLTLQARKIQTFLEEILNESSRGDEIERPERLRLAMCHAVLNGGKRLRPFFVLETSFLFQGSEKAALYVGGALELLHCYSLIHDDLPAMDNDDLRRGQPTVHKAFDEATAILAGDALLTLAFDLLSREQNPLSDTIKLQLVQKLSQNCGFGGMVGGQMLDMHPLGQQQQQILTTQTMKTALLFRFACEAGTIIAKAEMRDQKRMAEFGLAIGLAFQLADDLLDNTATEAILGKTTGKDLKDNKATLLALYGEEFIKTQLKTLIDKAFAFLEPYQAKADILRQAALFVIQREF